MALIRSSVVAVLPVMSLHDSLLPSNMSGAVADNEGSSPEPSRERKMRGVSEEGVALGEQAAKGESKEGGVVPDGPEEGGVVLDGPERGRILDEPQEGGVAPSTSQVGTAESAVGTEEQETSAQQNQVGKHCMSSSHCSA